MSVRHLAGDATQPKAFAFTAENEAWARRKMLDYPAGRQASAVLPVLWRAQEQEGWLSRQAIETVARLLSMPYIRVLEVATFYTQFQLQPVGAYAHIQVCGTTPCMLRGSEALMDVCRERIHVEPHHTNPEGTLSWEEVECLGACVNAPMVLIGNDTYEDLTVERFEDIIVEFGLGRGARVKTGSQIVRETSAAEGGRTTLLEPPTTTRTYKPFPPPPPPANAPAGAPPAAATPPTPAAPPPPPAATAPVPVNKGRGNEVVEENAPALKDPKSAPKVSEAKAEGERANANASAGANGEPNRAMRETATGAESAAGKRDGGRKAEPRKLFEAPAGAADDLKLITGIGPVLERTLNAVGITTWAQIARLAPEQILDVEHELAFRGRITRDRWLEQADALATGGVAEYVRRFGKAPR